MGKRFAAALGAPAVLSILVACSASQDGAPSSSDEPSPSQTGGSAVVQNPGGAGSQAIGPGGGGGSPGTGGSVGGTSGSAGAGGARDAGAKADAGNVVRPPPDPCIEAGTCPVGVWTNVTPANANLTPSGTCANYGTLSAIVSPLHPETMYTEFNCGGIWKSTDYRQTWNGPVNTGANGVTVS